MPYRSTQESLLLCLSSVIKFFLIFLSDYGHITRGPVVKLKFKNIAEQLLELKKRVDVLLIKKLCFSV